MPVGLGLGPAMAARQGTGPGDFPEHQERPVIKIVPVHAGHSRGVLLGACVMHGANKDQKFRNGYA